MGTAIEWTDSTWNPVTGCHHVSPGCEHCYAETLSLRFGWSTKPWTAPNAAENVVLHPDRLGKPLAWREPKRVFVNSMSDLFHEQVPDAFIAKVFAVMFLADHHTFQILTKRPDRMRRWVTGEGADLTSDAGYQSSWPMRSEQRIRLGRGFIEWPPENVWLGVSVEDQRRAEERIPLLLETPAAVHFLSCEPLLSWVNLNPWLWHGTVQGGDCRPSKELDWVIAGGESGPGFRAMHLDWARCLRDQCQSAEVAYLFKQVGGRTPKSGGRLLDGRTWDQYPDEGGKHAAARRAAWTEWTAAREGYEREASS